MNKREWIWWKMVSGGADDCICENFFAGAVCTKASSQRTHKARKDRA